MIRERSNPPIYGHRPSVLSLTGKRLLHDRNLMLSLRLHKVNTKNTKSAGTVAEPHLVALSRHVQQCRAAGTRRSKSAPERNAAPEKIKNAGQGPTSTDRCTESVTLPATSQTI